MTRMMVWRSYIWRATSVCGCCRLYLACAQTGLETSAKAAAAPIFCTNVLIILPPKDCPVSTDSQVFLSDGAPRQRAARRSSEWPTHHQQLPSCEREDQPCTA